jgi:uncharacterized protein (DUF488 family)
MPTLFTVGHSTRTFDEFVELLHAHGVRAVADVRLIPRSRRLPHFNDDAMARELPRHGIAYHSFKELGGRRRPRADSPNTAWRNESFRGYADYLATPEFLLGLDRLMRLAHDTPTTTMCAEAVPWRCHRSLISDALVVRGWTVLDILSPTKASPHGLTKFARVEGETITYPPEDANEPTLFKK